MDYVTNGTVSDDTTRDIDTEVNKIRRNSVLLKDYLDMQIHDDELKNESRAEGRAEGRTEGRTEGRLETLKQAIESLKKTMTTEAIVAMFNISDSERKILAI